MAAHTSPQSQMELAANLLLSALKNGGGGTLPLHSLKAMEPLDCRLHLACGALRGEGQRGALLPRLLLAPGAFDPFAPTLGPPLARRHCE